VVRDPDPDRVAAAYLTAMRPGYENTGRRDKGTLDAFMRDYFGMTFPNPLQPYMRVWSYRTEEGEDLPLIMTEIKPFDGYINFSAIISPDKQGTGQASKIIRKITKLADKHGVSLSATVKPFGNVPNALTKSQLAAWYKRNGWVKRPGGIIRYPGGAKAPPPDPE
jgi:hypothetical protein